MIIASNYDSYVSSQASGAADNAKRWRRGLAAGLRALKRPGVKVVLLGDTSRWHRPQDCIRRHQDDVSRCAIRRADAVSGSRIANDRAAARAAGARYVRTVGMTCPYDPCPIVIDRMHPGLRLGSSHERLLTHLVARPHGAPAPTLITDGDRRAAADPRLNIEMIVSALACSGA